MKKIGFCAVIMALVISGFSAAQTNMYDERLCANNEKVLISFRMRNSSKTLSVLIANNESYIVYRYGTRENVELEFPGDKTDSWRKFVYSYYFRGGGASNKGLDLNELFFDNGGYKYTVFDEYTAENGIRYAGIRITNKSTNIETVLEGLSSSVTGGLSYLRDNAEISTEK